MKNVLRKMSLAALIFGLLLSFSMPESGKAAFWDTKGDNFIHDPSIIKEGNTWYTFGTGLGTDI